MLKPEFQTVMSKPVNVELKYPVPFTAFLFLLGFSLVWIKPPSEWQSILTPNLCCVVPRITLPVTSESFTCHTLQTEIAASA